MAQALQNDVLLQSVGKSISGHKGEPLGQIMEVTRDENGTYIEYLILKSNTFFGRGERYFAIPASSSMVTITQSGRILINADRDDLQFAKGVAFEECPKPDYKLNGTIFELYKYRESGNESAMATGQSAVEEK